MMAPCLLYRIDRWEGGCAGVCCGAGRSDCVKAGRSDCVKALQLGTSSSFMHVLTKAVRCGQPQFYVTSLHATLHHNKPQNSDLPTFLSYYR